MTGKWNHPHPGPLPEGEGVNILVVDDEPIVCASYQRILADDGLNVRPAFSGQEALDRIENECFDLAILDLRIPAPGGLTLLRHMRKESPGTEVIVITGYPTIENAKESMRLGAFDFVPKPFDPETVRRAVIDALACVPWTLKRKEVSSCRPTPEEY